MPFFFQPERTHYKANLRELSIKPAQVEGDIDRLIGTQQHFNF